jgi:hypothetical protein
MEASYIIRFAANGNTVVCDRNGNQVPALQQAWIKMYFQFLIDNDIDPTYIDFVMPSGHHARAIEIKTKEYNWEISN